MNRTQHPSWVKRCISIKLPARPLSVVVQLGPKWCGAANAVMCQEQTFRDGASVARRNVIEPFLIADVLSPYGPNSGIRLPPRVIDGASRYSRDVP